jgi:DNA polymerase (family 10)
MAKDAGVRLSIASDSHAEQDFDNLAYGVSQARRGWLEPKDVINTYSLAELRSYLQRRHKMAA